jgi:hypothetical protein
VSLSSCFGLVIYQEFSLVFLLDRFLVGLLEVLFTTISLRACLLAVGSVELLLLAISSQRISCLLYVV